MWHPLLLALGWLHPDSCSIPAHAGFVTVQHGAVGRTGQERLVPCHRTGRNSSPLWEMRSVRSLTHSRDHGHYIPNWDRVHCPPSWECGSDANAGVPFALDKQR